MLDTVNAIADVDPEHRRTATAGDDDLLGLVALVSVQYGVLDRFVHGDHDVTARSLVEAGPDRQVLYAAVYLRRQIGIARNRQFQLNAASSLAVPTFAHARSSKGPAHESP